MTSRRRKAVVGAAALLAVVALVATVGRPVLARSFFPVGEIERHGVSTVVAGRSDHGGAFGLAAHHATVAITDDGCVVLEDFTFSGSPRAEGPTLVSWPPGARLDGRAGDVRVVLASGTSIHAGDSIQFGAHIGFSAFQHEKLPQACRTLPGVHLQEDTGRIEVAG